MKRHCSKPTRGLGVGSREKTRGGLRLWAALAAALGLVLVFGGGAAAVGVDCNPNAAGAAYPPADCAALTSTNAVGLGGKLAVSGGGFRPVSAVSVELHSSVVDLGSLTTDASGVAAGAVTIPESVPVGTHDLDLKGVNPDGTLRLLTAAVQIDALSKSGSGTSSGFGTLFWAGMGVAALAVLGALLLLIMRSRRG